MLAGAVDQRDSTIQRHRRNRSGSKELRSILSAKKRRYGNQESYGERMMPAFYPVPCRSLATLAKRLQFCGGITRYDLEMSCEMARSLLPTPRFTTVSTNSNV